MARLIFALCLAFRGQHSKPPSCEGDCWAQLQIEVEQLADLYGFPEGLLEAVMYHESRGDPWATGSSGEFGPMQIWPSTAGGIARQTNLSADAIMSDPITNLQAGAWFLNSLLVMFGHDVDKALAAYNGGPGTVLECDCVPSKLRGYVSGVYWAWNLPELWREPSVPRVWTIDDWFGTDLSAVPQCFASRR